jgi:nucleotide-binding universal stress UspA family protein
MAAPVQRKVKTPRYRRILWPTDFSALAKAALPHAVGLASVAGAELVLLHVLPLPAMYAVPEISGAVWVPLQRKIRAGAERRLRGLEKQAKGPNLRIHAVLAEGVPFLQILRVAKRLRCDLIVLATHGRTGLTHAIMGSVAENVIRRAPCPVLTVRPARFQRGA